MGRRYWLMKSEPDVYGWDDLVREGEGTWDGVRNYRARNNLADMKAGELAFFYHSNIGKEVVGIVEISAPGFPDPSDDSGKWVSVKVRPVEKLPRAVSLAELKAESKLAEMEVIKLSRLSVAEVRASEWELIKRMAAKPAKVNEQP